MSQDTTPDWLPFYVRDHLAGARAGANMFARIARVHNHPQVRTEIARLGAEVRQEYRELRGIMEGLGMRRATPTMLFTVAGEMAERLKLNGSLFQRAPAADILELEGLIAAVQAKARLWETLLAVMEAGAPLDGGQLRRLQEQAEGQRKTIIGLHSQVVHSFRATGAPGTQGQPG